MAKRGSNPSTENDNQGPHMVGYKRPPTSGQIKKGEVRNPHGRGGKKPKRGPGPQVNITDELRGVLSSLVRVTQNGECKQQSIVAAAALKIGMNVLAGTAKPHEHQTFRELLKFAMPQASATSAAPVVDEEAANAALDGYVRRHALGLLETSAAPDATRDAEDLDPEADHE